MEALELLLNRASQPRLTNPAPQGEALQNIMQSALQAPDHACLRPWKFVICTGDGLTKLGQLFDVAAKQEDMSEQAQQKAAQLPMRAPMVVVAIAKHQEHEKVPWVEQVASASCSIHSMQMAAVAQGFAGIWRTGKFAQSPIVKDGFGLNNEDEIVGFLYLGTAVTKARPRATKPTENYFEFWQ